MEGLIALPFTFPRGSRGRAPPGARCRRLLKRARGQFDPPGQGVLTGIGVVQDAQNVLRTVSLPGHPLGLVSGAREPHEPKSQLRSGTGLESRTFPVGNIHRAPARRGAARREIAFRRF
jgi:hypothetical protein